SSRSRRVSLGVSARPCTLPTSSRAAARPAIRSSPRSSPASTSFSRVAKMTSPLDNLVSIRKLKVEPPTQLELDGLMRSGTARITDAENATLNLESRFDLAYNAAHAFSLAALRRRGYRSDNRYLVFQSLVHTVGLATAEWRARRSAQEAERERVRGSHRNRRS